MSGGVDSSATAALLTRAGREVVGVTFIFSEEPPVPKQKSLDAAQSVADALRIEYHVVDMHEEFAERVIEPFAREYALGRTPNPCIRCNMTMKFAELFRLANRLDCDTIATGHYALVSRDEQGRMRVRRSSDPRKDQSYFLYRFTPEQLARLEFPLAGWEKDDVRSYARSQGLAPADYPESQDACFVGAGGYLEIVAARHPEALIGGEIVDEQGRVLGRHDGIAHFTVGQRKGLGIAAEHPLYVLSIDPGAKRVVVGPLESLATTEFDADDAVFHEPLAPEGEHLAVRIRHGMEPVGAWVTADSDTLHIVPDEPVAGIAPGQSVVCYREDLVVCGGVLR